MLSDIFIYIIENIIVPYFKLSLWKRVAIVFGVSAIGLSLWSFFTVAFLGWEWELWTGVGKYVEGQRTLWDWLELLIIPGVLTWGALYFNKQERESEKQIANDRQQETNLQNYYDKMTELLLEKWLRTSEDGAEVRSVARSRTLATLRTLDGNRKRLLLQFLYEAGLIFNPAIVSLADTDLSGIDLCNAQLKKINLSDAGLENAILIFACLDDACLRRANLDGADLNSAHLDGVDLREAILSDAVLSETSLNGADLRMAHLVGAILDRARLHNADLTGAMLWGATLKRTSLLLAKLDGAELGDADLTDADVSLGALKHVASLNNATMPDGTKYSAAWAARLDRPFPESETPTIQPIETLVSATVPPTPEAVAVTANNGDDGLGDE